MATQIDSIYCFDYTKEIGHCDSIRNFSSPKMVYIGLALSTPRVRVDASPYSFSIPGDGSDRLRQYVATQMNVLQEISEETAVNSPKYMLICCSDGSKRYFAYSEQFYVLFKIALQYKPQENESDETESPYALQETGQPSATVYAPSQRPAVQTASASPSSQPPVRQNSPYPLQTKKETVFSKRPILIAFIVFFVVALIISNIVNESSANKGLTPVDEPVSGELLSGSWHSDGSKITVSVDSGNSYVVKLKTRSGVERMSFYVRAGDTVTVNVPSERLYVFFASGDTWYGQRYLFGENTRYTKDENACDFSKYSRTYTLYPVTDGNFSETPIDAKDF